MRLGGGNLTHDEKDTLEGIEDNLYTYFEKIYIQESIKDTINICVFHAEALEQFKPKDCSKYFGCFFFETSKINSLAIQQINKLDKVLVASDWAKQVLILNGITSDKIQSEIGISLPILTGFLYGKTGDRSIPEFLDFKNKIYNNCGKTPIFGNIGKWETRKGHPLLIRAIAETALPITLVAMWNNPFIKENGLEEIKTTLVQEGYILKTVGSIKNNNLYLFENQYKSNIILVPSFKAYHDVISLLRDSIDIYISPSSGEGWNMPAVEAMSLGIPTIIPNNTAHLSYITTSSELSLDCYTELAYDGRWFNGQQGDWYPVYKEDLKDKIRHMFNTNTLDAYSNVCCKRIYEVVKQAKENMHKIKE